MFRSRNHRFPIMGLALFAGGFWMASILIRSGGAAAGAGAAGFVLLLPFLLLKLLFVFLLFGGLMRWASGGWGDRGRAGWGGPGRYDRIVPTPPPSAAEQEWEENLRAARREVEDLFPDPDPKGGDDRTGGTGSVED